MKILVVAVALVAFVYAQELPTNLKDRLEKWNSLSEEERQQLREAHKPSNIQEIPKEVLEQLREVYGAHYDHKKFQNVGTQEEIPKEVLEQLREVYKPHHADKRQKDIERFEAVCERLGSVPEGERKQELQKLFKEHHENIQNFGPHKIVPVEVREKLREIFAPLHAEKKDKMFEDIQATCERLNSLSIDERKQEMIKLLKKRDEKFNSFGHKNIPVEVHEKLREVFKVMPTEVLEKLREVYRVLPTEVREKLREVYNALPAENHGDEAVMEAVPYADFTSQFTEELSRNLREKFQKLSPEQLEEIRKQVGARPRPDLVNQRPRPDRFERPEE